MADPRAPSTSSLTPAAAAGAGLTAGAGIIHLAAVSSHLPSSLPLAVGFGLVGLVQLAGAGLVAWRGSRTLTSALLVVNLASVAIWGVSRVVGLPLDGHLGAESVRLADALTVALEIAASAGLLLSHSSWRDQTSRVITIGLISVGVALAGSTAAIADLGGGHHAAGEQHAGGAHGEGGHAQDGDHDAGHHDEQTGGDTDPADTSGTATVPGPRADRAPGPAPSTTPTPVPAPTAADGHNHTHDEE